MKPALSRLREARPSPLHVLRAAQLCLARRAKVLAVVRRTDPIRVRAQRRDDRPKFGSAQRRAIPRDVIDGSRESTPAFRFERFVEWPSRAITRTGCPTCRRR